MTAPKEDCFQRRLSPPKLSFKRKKYADTKDLPRSGRSFHRQGALIKRSKEKNADIPALLRGRPLVSAPGPETGEPVSFPEGPAGRRTPLCSARTRAVDPGKRRNDFAAGAAPVPQVVGKMRVFFRTAVGSVLSLRIFGACALSLLRKSGACVLSLLRKSGACVLSLLRIFGACVLSLLRIFGARALILRSSGCAQSILLRGGRRDRRVGFCHSRDRERYFLFRCRRKRCSDLYSAQSGERDTRSMRGLHVSEAPAGFFHGSRFRVRICKKSIG